MLSLVPPTPHTTAAAAAHAYTTDTPSLALAGGVKTQTSL